MSDRRMYKALIGPSQLTSKKVIRLCGEKNGQWLGDAIKSITAIHTWVNRHKPKPVDGKCEICRNKPFYDLASITGLYNRDIDNYQYLCRSCHMLSDGRRKGKPSPFRGRHHTAEAIRKISLANKLTKQSRVS